MEEQQLPFDSTGLFDEDINSFLETCKAIEKSCAVQYDNNFMFDFRSFSLFENCNETSIKCVIKTGNSGNTHITFLEIDHQTVGIRGGTRIIDDRQTWGVATLKNNFGHILIRPETFVDKLNEFFMPVELDFDDDREFSNKFYVLADDKDKAIKAIDINFRNAVLNISEKDFMIEIINNKLIIGNKKPVEPESAVCFAEFINKAAAL